MNMTLKKDWYRLIQRVIILTSLPLLGLGWASCSSDDDVTIVAPSAEGTMQDLEGNEYRWVRIDTLDWMAENLHAGTPWYNNSRFDSDDGEEDYYPIFGNYYSYAEALNQCPEGWRLPTDDDWKCLERACGMSASNADRTGWRNGAGHRMASTESINLRYGGELAAVFTIAIQLYQPYSYGLYWSQTIDTSLTDRCAFIRKITPGQDQVQRISTPVGTHWLSVRYVRTAR